MLYSDFWQIFEWKFGGILILVCSDLGDPLGGIGGHYTPEHELYQISAQKFARNLNITFKKF